MSKITLKRMTRELYHEFYKAFESDAMTYLDKDFFEPFVYTAEWVDEYVDKQSILRRLVFAIMLDGSPIGEIKLYDIDKCAKQCTLCIHMQNDEYKGRGYGSEAIRQACAYAKDFLCLHSVCAHTIISNIRSQHVLEKCGFIETIRDDQSVYYEKSLQSTRPCNIHLVPMTLDLANKYFDGYKEDFASYRYSHHITDYVYSPAVVAEYMDKQSRLGQILFAIMLDGAPIGEVKFFGFSKKRRECTLSVRMKNNDYKNLGYGSRAVSIVLAYAKAALKDVDKVWARVFSSNTRAWRVARKSGFKVDYIEDKTAYFLRDFTDNRVPKPISFERMTRDLYHQFYQGFVTDPPKGRDHSYYRQHYYSPVEYDAEWLDRYYSLEVALGRHNYAIMQDGNPIGYVTLIEYNHEDGLCMMQGVLQSSAVKNLGYGTQALDWAINYVKNVMRFQKLWCIVEKYETAAQHMLEKVGFVGEDNRGNIEYILDLSAI